MQNNTRAFVVATIVLLLIGGGIGATAAVGLKSLSWSLFQASAEQLVRDVLKREREEQIAQRSQLADAHAKALDMAKADVAERLALVEERLFVVETERDQVVVAVAEKRAVLESLVQERDGLAEQVRAARAKLAADEHREAVPRQTAAPDTEPVSVELPKNITNSIGMEFRKS